jgi:hypothetical protein
MSRGVFVQTGWTTTITPSGSAHTKGAWATVASSISIEIAGFIFSMTHPWDRRALTDIAIGDGGNKYNVVDNLYSGFLFSNFERGEVPITYIPRRIAAGSNIYMRGQCTAGGNTYRATLTPYWGGFGHYGFQRCLVLGADTAGTAGQALSTTYAELTASLIHEVKYIQPIILWTAAGGGSVTEGSLYISTGGAGSEIVLYECRYTFQNADYLPTAALPPLHVQIAEGSRVAAAISDADGNNKGDIILYCFS